MIDRRTFLAGTGAVFLAAPLAAEAQKQPGKVWRISVLSPGAPGHSAPLEAFRQGLRSLGYIEGQNTIIDERFAQDQNDRLPVLARDLVQAGVDVIFAINTPAVLAAKQATRTIPIVVTRVSDPIGAGLMASLAHPGGNITGLTTVFPGIERQAPGTAARSIAAGAASSHPLESGQHRAYGECEGNGSSRSTTASPRVCPGGAPREGLVERDSDCSQQPSGRPGG